MLYKPRQGVKVSNFGDDYWWFNNKQGGKWNGVGKNRQETNQDSDFKEKVKVDRSHLKKTG